MGFSFHSTPEELDEIRAKQEAAKIRPGYYGIWAKCRNMPLDEAVERIKNGEKYICLVFENVIILHQILKQTNLMKNFYLRIKILNIILWLRNYTIK